MRPVGGGEAFNSISRPLNFPLSPKLSLSTFGCDFQTTLNNCVLDDGGEDVDGAE